jgi:two-component system, NtrC family, nitrogen regulation sensor histidine kinase NtrY
VQFITSINNFIKTLLKKVFLGSKILPIFANYFFAIVLAALLVLLAFSLISVFNSSISQSNNQLAFININFILIALVATLFTRYCMYLFMYRKKGFSKIKLNTRLAGMFSILAFIPGITVLCFALVFINSGVETWFSSRVTTSLDSSLRVAQAYLTEHEERLLSESKNLAKDPIFSAPSFLIDSQALSQILAEELEERNLAEISLYDNKGNLMEFSGDLVPSLKSNEIVQSFENSLFDTKGVIYKEDSNNRITAIAKLPLDSGYLVLRRWIHPAVLYYLDSTQKAYQEYYQISSERDQIKLLFSLLFILFSISLLCGSVYFSIRLSRRIVHPLENLVEGTKQIAIGNFTTNIKALDNDEIGELTKAFNSMAHDMNKQQIELNARHKEIKNKSKTLEAILTGVSSGVFTLNDKGTIRMSNKAAMNTFDLKIGENIKNHSIEITELANHFFKTNNPYKTMQEQITVNFEETSKEFLIRIVSIDVKKDDVKTILITFDDITELKSAQKVGAWADVAKRMAHEIKNPLTPIQLSAERLKRRFSKQIKEDESLFSDLTQIIIRQVDDLRCLVNEFSDFARMPSPTFEKVNLTSIIREIMLLQSNRSNIKINLDLEHSDLPINCDALQIKRVLTNLIENSVNAIEENNKNSSGAIDIVAKISQNSNIHLKIIDNGPGIPDDVDINQLFDPYITTRKKGTGLGLAIVKKIIDEHKGSVNLLRRKPNGTVVSIILPLEKD